MHRAQQKGKQEQQDSDEEVSAPSPAPTRPQAPVAGPSNPSAASSSLQDTRLGKRKVREVETEDSLPPCKRSRTSQNAHMRSNPSVQSNNEHDHVGGADSRPSNQPSTRPPARVFAQAAQAVPHDFTPLSSPSQCSTPIPLPWLPLPIPTSKFRAPAVPLPPPAVICQSPAQPRNNSADVQSGPPSRNNQPMTSILRPRTRNKAEFINIELNLEFSGDEQEEEQAEQEVREDEIPAVFGFRRKENQSANGDEDSDKTEPDTDTGRGGGGSETSDESQLNDSQIGMETQDYAMPWRRYLPAIPSTPYGEQRTVPIQRGNKNQVLVHASQSTNLQSMGNSDSQAEAGPSRRVDPSTRSVESTGSLLQKEREMDPDTSCVSDSQDDISLLGPSSRLYCIPSSSLPSSVPESNPPQPEEKPLSQPSQPTDPDFVPGNASFDEHTDPLEFMIGVGSQSEASLELKDEVDRLGRVVNYEDAGYALRDRETMRRSESGASTGTDTMTLVEDYFEAKEEEIKKGMEETQESQLTRTEGTQCQPSQPLASESQGSQPLPTQSGPSESTPMKPHHLRSRIKSLSSRHEERKKRLVVAVLDLIAHWLQVKDVKLVHDVWNDLPLHEQTFDRVLRVCLQYDLSAVQQHPSRRRTPIGSSDDEGDAGGERGQSIGFMRLRQRYMIVPNPKRKFPFPKGRDPGHAWTKVICRLLGAMYGFKAQYVHQLWTDTGEDICEVERQLEGRKTGWLDFRELGFGDIPRPWA